jgi:hypothetical protein
MMTQNAPALQAAPAIYPSRIKLKQHQRANVFGPNLRGRAVAQTL